MKKNKTKLLAIIVTVALLLTLVSATAFTAPTPADYGTQRDYVLALIRSAGLKESVIGTSATDRDALARGLGFFDKWNYSPTAMVNDDNKAAIDAAMADAYNGLYEALHKQPMEPYFVHGLAQPIFPYGDSATKDTTGEGLVRFLVYVETEYDSDSDGKLDLTAVFVQLPRACIDSGMKAGTIFHGQPYNEGTNDGTGYSTAQRTDGNNWLNQNGAYTHARLHGEVPITPRVTAGYVTTKEMVANSDPLDWKYTYTSRVSGSNLYADVTPRVLSGNQISSTTTHNYYAVRGFALISSAGIGTYLGDGLSTYGADVEIGAYKSAVDWLNGNARAFTNKTDNIEIKADWSNGLVGMTGTSYGGTIPVGVASTGVKGLETIVPVCGIASYYEYQNQQGAVNWRAQYTPGMSKYVSNNYGKPTFRLAGDPLRGRQLGYTHQMFRESLELNGTYGEHWLNRDYTVDGWSRDWGPSKMTASMLIIEGFNDNNVRPKQGVLMYQMTQKAGVPGRMLWMQGNHTTPNNQMIGDYIYQEWLNMWFSHYLYKVDNGVLEKFPEVYAQNNRTGEYVAYDSWESAVNLVLDKSNRVMPTAFGTLSAPQREYEVPVENKYDYYLIGGDGNGEPPLLPEAAADEIVPALDNALPSKGFSASAVNASSAAATFTTLNSANGNASWQNLLDAQTAGSILYSFVLPEDITVKGCVAINFRAAVQTLGANFYTGLNTTTEAAPQAKIHGKLVEVAAPGRYVTAFGGNTIGNAPSSQTVATGGVYVGGGLASSNLSRYTSVSNITYRELARGHMSLAHPGSGFDSITSGPSSYIDLTNNIGVYHDYTMYLQPVVHTATKGNRLALILTIGHNTNDGIVTGAVTGANAFTFTVDDEASNVEIPVVMAAPDPVTISVSSAHVVPGDKVDITYSITDNGHGFTSLDVDLPFNSSVYTPLAVTPSALLSGGTLGHAISGNVLNVTYNSAGYTVGDGALFTVTYQVNEAAYAFSGPLNVKVNGLKYGDFLNNLLDLDVTVKPGVLSTHSYQVYLKPDKTKLVVGDTVMVDVMLVGGLNYTQVATEISFDAGQLDYLGHTDLQGWAAAVTKPAADKIAIRSVPGMNMVAGMPCSGHVKLVTLKFKATGNFNAESFDIALNFASILVSPPGGVTGTTTVPGKPATITWLKPGNEHLQANLLNFPTMWDVANNRLRAIFSDSRVIQEQVWIEVPVDTDFDGKRDLQRIIIRRPSETLPTSGGLKCPAIIGMTPYHTTGGTGAAFNAFSGRVYDGFPDQGLAPTRFQHTRFKARPAGVAGVLADRSHWDQILGAENDLSYRALRDVTERRVGKGAEAGVARYLDLLEDGMLKATTYTAQQAADYPWLPPARVPTGWQLNGVSATANPGGGGYGSAATNLPYGYAMIQVSILGSDYAQGLLQYGMYQESLAAAAVFDWLNGRIRGFTGPDGLIEVEAYWATGEGIASGTSYGGTLPVAAAVTGVQGLRSIYPGAPVTNAYYYYRENSLPYAPGGYQGEDITSTTYYTQGRFWSASAPANPGQSSPLWDAWWDWELYLRQEMDAKTGNYSPFWDERNPLSFGYDMRKDVGVIMGAGLNDGNVKIRNTGILNEMLKHYGVEVVKGQFTQGEHTMGNSATGAWTTTAAMREWVDLYLYGVKSDITTRSPNYHIQSNIGTNQWKDYSVWPAGNYQKFYPVGGKVGTLAATPQATVTSTTFKDDFLASSLASFPVPNYNTAQPTGAHIQRNGLDLANGWLPNALVHLGRGGSLGTVNNWRNRIVGGVNNSSTAWSAPANRYRIASSALTGTFSKTNAVTDRVLYLMPITSSFTISGFVTMTAEVAASKDAGALSAMLVEWWSGGVKVVALGSVDVRNPNPDGTLSLDVPGLDNISKGGNWHANYLFQSKDIIPYGTSAPTAANFNSYTWEMDITEYTFTAGRELGIILYGSDAEFTYMTKDPAEFTVNIGPNTYLSLPVVGAPVPVPEAAAEEEEPAFEDVPDIVNYAIEDEVDEVIEAIIE